jgi:hypothetical protein
MPTDMLYILVDIPVTGNYNGDVNSLKHSGYYTCHLFNVKKT